ncbi:DUF748 domain-containing protein [Massilia sp. TS11]|uniref:DUF748 domain-containing protein n=1 Tax=Massilia sp. TS11 TaxID=2908003 RepID=UPI001EDA0F65|nr:DUF748 domain-containing protein [Massilia sp. TS11]MCG2584322.1 DUF748 domain-containing protein [Massilia sp. TS11]
MRLRRPSLKALALTLLGVSGALLLLAWQALPGFIQSQAEKYIAEKSGHHLRMARPQIDWGALRLDLRDVVLSEPDGKRLLSVPLLSIDLSASSLHQRALVCDAVRIEGLQAELALDRAGKFNWAPLIAALSSPPSAPDTPLPRLEIQSLVLAGGRLAFADAASQYALKIMPLDLALYQVSTLSSGPGRYQLAASTGDGARLQWRGQFGLQPLSLNGHLQLDHLNLAGLRPYLDPLLPVTLAKGQLNLAGDLHLAQRAKGFALRTEAVQLGVRGLRIEPDRPGMPVFDIAELALKGGQYDLASQQLKLGQLVLSGNLVDLPQAGGAPMNLLELAEARLEDAQLALGKQRVDMGRLLLRGGKLHGVRDARGRVDVVEALRSTAGPKGGKASAGPAWQVALDKLELADFVADFRDETVSPAAAFQLDDIDFSLAKLSTDLTRALPLQLAVHVRSGGTLQAKGSVAPASGLADLDLKLSDLALAPAQPYLSKVARLRFAGGAMSGEGRAQLGQGGASFRGGFALRDLNLQDADSGDTVVSFRKLGTRSLDASTRALAIRELSVEGLDTSLVIAKDRSVNVSRIFRHAGTAAPAPAAATAAPVFPVSIDRLRLIDGEMDFADLSLALPFGTRIHKLNGSINGLSTRRGVPGQVELDGQVDEFGLARAVGQLDLMNPAAFMDLKVVFRNVEMTRLTPYSATFAGRKIDSGKLSLDLEYRIKQRQLEGDNKIVMDRLVLGSRVDSASAKDLPLDLAIALLEDADGRIDLGLPVSGSLDDPEFSYGSLVWKAIRNVVGKLVTAPFRALGALFGAHETFEKIAFEPGAAALTPPEREKLLRLVGMLDKRPGLVLTMHGVYAEADRAALRDSRLRRAIALKAGLSLAGDEDPGPLSTQTPAIQVAIEALYAERFGAAELATLKAAYRQANPGKTDEGVAGKMMSRLAGLFTKTPQFSAAELASWQGADFHARLAERLLAREDVDDAALRALAEERARQLRAALEAAGAAAARVLVGAPELSTTEGRDIPLKLVLGAAPRQ